MSGCINQARFTSLDNDQSVLSSVKKPVEIKSVYTESNPEFYLVKPGDTLYSIAFRFGLDYKKLANANNIDRNYTIFEGQALALKELNTNQIVVQTTKPVVNKPPPVNSPAPVTEINKESVELSKAVNQLGSSAPQSWLWPHNGKIVRTYQENSSTQKGIDLSGVIGDSVIAAASGIVVYAGNGLPGYGNLIIVEHSGSLLSAYAFAQKILVNESDKVSAGQQIATMGKQGDQPGLHFEIRRNGKPVNPQSYLPKR